MKTLAKLLPLLGLGALVTGAVLSLDSSSDARGASRAQPTQDALAPARSGGVRSASVDGVRPCALPIGARMDFDVETRTRSVVDMGELAADMRASSGAVGFAAAPSIDRAASRIWHLAIEPIERDETGATVLAARIDDSGVDMGPEGLAASPEGMDDTFLVRLDASCAVEEFAWRPAANLGAAQEQQVLFSALSFVAPPQPGDERYTASTFDAAGHYLAELSRTSSNVLEGRVLEYEESFAATQGGVEPQLQVESSQLRIELAAGGWFSSLAHDRELSVSVRDQEVGTLASYTHATATEPSAWRAQVEHTEHGWRWGTLLGRVAPTSPRTQFDAALAGVPLDGVLASFLEAFADGGGGRDDADRLTQWLRANPEGADELLAALRGGALDDNARAYATSFLALAKADTEQSQAALVDLVRNSDARGRDSISAAHAMSMVPTPNLDMVAAIAEQAGNGGLFVGDRGSVAMAMGTFAAQNDMRAPELAAEARDHIEGWLDGNRDPAELAGSLYAAGNAGGDQLLDAVSPYLEHEDAEVRRHATHALRKMSPDEVFPHLQSGMNDADDGVRLESLRVAAEVSQTHGVRPPADLVDGAIDALRDEVAPAEESALVGVLGAASRLGDDAAGSALAERFEDEMLSDARDPRRLQALGRHTNVRWTADG